MHTVIGKASFDVDKLADNFAAMVEEITRQRPAAAKGRYFESVSISTSASPSIPMNPKAVLDEDDIELVTA